jgi:hypothetical protein
VSCAKSRRDSRPLFSIPDILSYAQRTGETISDRIAKTEPQECEIHFTEREKAVFLFNPKTLMRYRADAERAVHPTCALHHPRLELGQGKDRQNNDQHEKDATAIYP